MLKNSLMIQKIENKKPTKRLTFKDAAPERKRNSSSDARTRPRDFRITNDADKPGAEMSEN